MIDFDGPDPRDRWREINVKPGHEDEWDSRPSAVVVYMLVSVLLLAVVAGAAYAWMGKAS